MQQAERYSNTPTLHVPVTVQPVANSDPANKSNYYDIEVNENLFIAITCLCDLYGFPPTQSQPPTILNSGVYRQRSYDNLHNGKSPSMQSLTRFVHLPRSSCDHIADLTVGAAIAAMSSDASSSSSSPSPSPATGGAPVPIHFKYFAPQQQNHSNFPSSCESSQSIGAFSRYPFHQNKAVPCRPLPNQQQPQVGPKCESIAPQPLSDLSDNDIRAYLDLNSPTSHRPPISLNITPIVEPSAPPEPPQLYNVYRYRRHHRTGTSSGRNNDHRLHNRSNRYQPRRKSSALSLLKDLDFIDESEDDPMLKDCNQFRVTRQHSQYSSSGSIGHGQPHDRDDRSPLKKKQRYSNIYDYSFNLSLNSIHEDSTSDDSL